MLFARLIFISHKFFLLLCPETFFISPSLATTYKQLATRLKNYVNMGCISKSYNNINCVRDMYLN